MHESCRETFKSKDILTAPCTYIYKCLTFAKKNLHLFDTNSAVHDYSTRHGNLLRIPLYNTTTFKHSPTYNCIILYNKLPDNIKSISNYLIFKREIRTLLTTGGYYSIGEFLTESFNQ